MTRSSYKLPFVHRSLWAKSIDSYKWVHWKLKLCVYPKKDEISPYIDSRYMVWSRSSLVPKNLATSGLKVAVFNGLIFQIFVFQSKYTGQKLGQFFYTRRPARHKGKQRQQKKVQKKTLNQKIWV